MKAATQLQVGGQAHAPTGAVAVQGELGVEVEGQRWGGLPGVHGFKEEVALLAALVFVAANGDAAGGPEGQLLAGPKHHGLAAKTQVEATVAGVGVHEGIAGLDAVEHAGSQLKLEVVRH